MIPWMKRNPFLVLGVMLLIVGGWLLVLSVLMSDSEEPMSDTREASEFIYEISDTPEEQVRGLSGRATIPDHYGMLFVLSEVSRPGIWMKDMLVPIDIVWLSDTGTIVGIEHEVSPDTYPTSFRPPVPVSYVLETRAGYARDNGWDIGTQLPLPER